MAGLRIVFDLDDTLYPEREFALSGFRAAGRWAHGELGIAGLEHDMTQLFDDGHLGPLFKLALERHKPDHDPHHLEALVEAWRTHTPEISLFDDAAWALGNYGARAPIGLITDGTASMQANKVRALELADRFEQIIYTDALGGRSYRKPHPLAYERMEAVLGAPGVTLVYVGDNPAKDFVTPNARGWISVQIRRPEARGIHDPDKVADGGAPQHVIGSLRELPRVLGA